MLVVITASGKFTEQAVQDLITDFFAPYIGQELKIEEQGAEHQFIHACIDELDDPIPVYDLAKGLYPVTRMALDSAESHAETLSGSSTSDHTNERPEVSESFSAQLADWTLEELKELENDLHHAIRVKETLHTPYVNGRREQQEVIINGVATTVDELNDILDEELAKIKCYKSKTGKIRKAGKSKARPGETEVWLAEEEINS